MKRWSSGRHPLVLAFVTISSAVWGVGDLEAQCTGASPDAHSIVTSFATTATPARPAGVPVVASSQIRLLGDIEGDAGTCHQLRQLFEARLKDPASAANWTLSYYEVGDLYYIMAIRATPAGTISTYWSPLIIVNRLFRIVGSVGR
jgi:hypothetical protein